MSVHEGAMGLADRAMVEAQGDSPGSTSRALAIARDGIKTGKQFAATMSALMTDILEGSVSPEIGNAVCNAGGKMLKVVEMEYKYGTKTARNSDRALNLIAE